MTSETFRNQGLFLRNQFQGEGMFGIPIVKKQHVNVETVTLVGYDHVKAEEKKFTHAMVHFFLDDYKFEVLWNNPEPRIKKLAQYRAVLTPQYSLYTEMPMTLQLYNTFRNRWVGAYLQSRDITVIPTVCWGTPKSYWFCFDGLETGSIVAVSTLGVRTEKELFMHGYQEMIKRVNPEAVICYGNPFDEMEGNIIAVDYAKTNNLSKWADYICGEKEIPFNSNLIVKRYGYVLNEKGMGRASGQWKPKKEDDKRFLGKPGETKTTTKKNGDTYITRIGKNGRATSERHNSTYGNPKEHPNPHEHDVIWQENGAPTLGPGRPVSEKNKYINFGGVIKMSNQYEPKFEDLDDFLDSLLRGREIVIEYHGKQYGIFYLEKGFYVAQSYHDETGKLYRTPDEALEYTIDGTKLRDIITVVNVVQRNF